jgi:hypothetical protein
MIWPMRMPEITEIKVDSFIEKYLPNTTQSRVRK